MKNNLIMVCLIFAAVFSSATAKHLSKPSDADTILANVVEGFVNVRDFIATIEAEVKMEKVQVPNMHATMYFKKPDKTHFESSGFLFVPRDGITLNPDVLSDRYDASLMETEMLEGRMHYKLQLAAKEKKTKLRQMYVWIESVHWTIEKIETIPYEGRTLSMVFTYGLVDDKYWLPSKIIFTLGSTAEKEKSSDDLGSQQQDQFSQMQRTMPRSGSISIVYTDYKVNSGIDNSIFEEKKK
jgi:outer membrane lipoprotein-sorting protein